MATLNFDSLLQTQCELGNEFIKSLLTNNVLSNESIICIPENDKIKKYQRNTKNKKIIMKIITRKQNL